MAYYERLNIKDIFQEEVFTDEVMQRYMSEDAYRALKDVIARGDELPRSLADEVAAAMKTWAVEKGATHFTHWFQPMTEYTAEKHDSFISVDKDGKVLLEFSGKSLSKGEADASSFPSGGIRATFEARGYTVWDCSSPAFIKRSKGGAGVLCIPTAFCAYTGEALDKKTPLLRSMNVLNREVLRLLRILGDNETKKVTPVVGGEQEYFLIDKNHYMQREDLKYAGRTLFGAPPAKGQEKSDQYYATIRDRVAFFMEDLNRELWKLGIAAKTEHNEVAPAQHELAPIFTSANIATDQNQLIMETMKKVAEKHDLACLLHEKPFNGVNGSGKHNNWSLSTDTGVLLFKPGKTIKENLQFITFISNVMSTVYKYNGLIKASISSATNAHRLGANEAPPAIISIFMGEQISSILESLVNADKEDRLNVSGKSGLSLNMSQIPELLLDNTDRNRTSPFAFTGNRFEFRAVGSSANCASAMIAVNSALAEQLMEFKEAVDARVAKGEAVFDAILAENKKLIEESKAIHFDGNGYSEEWKEEAKRRGLDCETSVPLIFDRYLDEKTVNMFQKVGVFTKVELEARNEVKWETYTKKVQIESRCFGDMALNHIIPVATKYQNMLLDNVYKIKSLFPHEKGEKIAAQDMAMIENMAEHMQFIKDKVQEMIEARKVANKIESQREKAIAYHDTVVPYLESIRYHIDKLELMVDDEMWPLPKYRELLFIR